MADALRERPARGGLTAAEAQERLALDGPNAVTVQRHVPLWRRVTGQLKDPLIVVLLLAAALTVVTGDLTDATVIALVVVVNTAVGVAQEVRADHAVAALASATAPRARVERDGHEQMVPAETVVRGDVLVLGQGDLVAADAELVEAAALQVDESSVTGEAVPVEKDPADERAADEEQHILFSGTAVVHGRGRAVVTATGSASTVGRIAALLETAPPATPLQRRLVGLGRVLAGVAVLLSAVVLVLGLVRGQPLELMAVTAVSLVVAAVPESLPAVVTLSLALGARRMAALNAVVRRLPAVETLGSVSVIATDKTGTITGGRMVVQRLWSPADEATLTGEGYAPAGQLRRGDHAVAPEEAPHLVTLLEAAVLCSDAVLLPPDEESSQWSALGDPTEAALVAAGHKVGVRPTALQEHRPRVAEFPFDSVRKRMTTVNRASDGVDVLSKGAPEQVLTPDVLGDDQTVLDAARGTAHDWAASGLRVLAVAAARRPDVPATAEEAERHLRLLGLVGIVDPPKTSAASTIEGIRGAGIAPVLITGDHPATAAAIAVEVGIADSADEVVDARAGGIEDDAVATRAAVVARATPRQKVQIVEARRRSGQIVAMTGDGVNDGPALRHADIGVAMGQRGTEVARQAADLVLADDELTTLVAAVGEGRRVYANVRRFLLYGLSGGAAEILVMLAGPFLGMPLPLLPAQILWVNLLTHGLVGVSLGAEPSEEDVMRRPPRPAEESVLGAGLWQRVLRVGLFITVATLAVGILGVQTERPWQTMTFVTLGATQLGVALALRARPGTRANPFLVVAVVAAGLLQLAAVYLSPLSTLLGTQPLGVAEVAIAAAFSLAGYVAVKLDRRLHPSAGAR